MAETSSPVVLPALLFAASALALTDAPTLLAAFDVVELDGPIVTVEPALIVKEF